MLEAWNYGATDRRKYGTHLVGVTELQINGSTDFYGIKRYGF